MYHIAGRYYKSKLEKSASEVMFVILNSLVEMYKNIKQKISGNVCKRYANLLILQS